MSDPRVLFLISLLVAWFVVAFWREILAGALVLGVALLITGVLSIISAVD